MESEILLTPASLLDLLSQIDELSEYDVQIAEQGDQLQLKVGQSTYTIVGDIHEAAVPEQVVEDVNTWSDDSISELVDNQYAELEEITPVTSGIIKEAAKTLLVGGLVRLTAKLLKR